MAHGPSQAVFGLGRPVTGSGLQDENEDNDLAGILGDDANDGVVDAGVIATGAVGSAEIASNAVDSAEIVAGAVDKTHLSGGFLAAALVAGQDETSDTTIPVTGIAEADELVAVFVQNGTTGVLTARALTDFTLSADTLTVDDNAANNTGNFYLVLYLDLT